MNNMEIKKIDTTPIAVPFIIFSNGKFVITEEAQTLLRDSSLNHVGLISLVGRYRTGKSFLLNRVLLNKSKENGFNVGPTIRPCTKGIWIWSEPIQIENNHFKEKFNVFFIDTEGLGAYDEEINHDSKIFLIAVLISSLFILNSFGTIDENSINSLSFILNLSKTIKLTANEKNSNPDELAKYFPSLLWLLRDFSLKLEDLDGNTITAKQYLENALMPNKGSSDIIEEKNKVRKMITTYFAERDCFTLVRPVEEESSLQNLQTLDNNSLRPEFIEQAEVLRGKVFKKVRPKIFNGRVLSGSMLLELVKSIIDSINSGSIPVIENSWKYVMHGEAVKVINGSIEDYKKQINEFRERYKSDPDYFKKFENFEKTLSKKFCDNLKTLDSGSDYLESLKDKLLEEYTKFNNENIKLFEKQMIEIMDKNGKILCDEFETDKYIKNYFQFFQDVENFKEVIELSTPDFPKKKEILFEKILTIVKKFIELTFLKNKISNEKEIVSLRNELSTLTGKFNLKNEEFENLKKDSSNTIDKLNNQILETKLNHKSVDDRIKEVDKEKKQLELNHEKNIHNIKKELDLKIEKYLIENNEMRNDLRIKENLIESMKFANEKSVALNEQKVKFMQNEIDSLKERIQASKLESNQNKNIIDELNSKIEDLKADNNKKKLLEIELDRLKKETAEKPERPSRLYDAESNSEVISLLKSQIVSSKDQLEETKKMYEEVINSLRKGTNNEEYKEIAESNKNLTLSLSNYESRCIGLEEKVIKLKELKAILKASEALQCRHCAKFYNFEIFRNHYIICQQDIMKKSIEKWNDTSSDKFKIKILKGILNKDELGKPFIEYITDITFNTQNWRINKKFNQFANLHKSLKNTFPDMKFPESASIFSKILEVSNNNFHENKIKQLEKYLKDISEIPFINKSKQFRKFFDFDEYYDETSDNKDKILIDDQNPEEVIQDSVEKEGSEKSTNDRESAKKKLTFISIPKIGQVKKFNLTNKLSRTTKSSLLGTSQDKVKP